MRTSFRNRVVFFSGSNAVARAALYAQDLLCAARCEKIHLGSVRCCTNTGCPALKARKIYLLFMFLFSFCLSVCVPVPLYRCVELCMLSSHYYSYFQDHNFMIGGPLPALHTAINLLLSFKEKEISTCGTIPLWPFHPAHALLDYLINYQQLHSQEEALTAYRVSHLRSCGRCLGL